MAHKTYLEQLLSNSIQKLNDFVDVLRMESFNNALHRHALNEWEAAENVYMAHLQQFNQISPEDAIAS